MNALRSLVARALLQRMRVPRDIARFAFNRYAERQALVTDSAQLTYSELGDRSLRLVATLSALGIGKGDSLLTLVPDGHERVEMSVAAWEAGISLTQLPASVDPERARHIVDVISPDGLMFDPSVAGPAAQTVIAAHPDVVQMRVGPDGNYEHLLADHSPAGSSQPLRSSDIGGVGFTSGTTGDPKAIVTEQGTQLTSLRLIVRNFGVGETGGAPESMVIGIPMTGAGSGAILPTLLSGAKLVIPRAYTAEAIAEAIEFHRATRCFVTPSMLIDLLDLGEDEYDLGSLQNLIYGSEQTPAAKIEEALERFGPIIQQGYGSAEVLPPLATLSAGDHMVNGRPAERRILASAGKVVPQVGLRILGEDGHELAAGEIGSISVKSPTAFDGYLNRPDLNASEFQDGWFRIGDVGYLDPGGYLHVLGRAADVIRIGDRTIYPRFVEEVAHHHPAVKETAFVQVGDEAVLVASLRRRYRAAGEGREDSIPDEIESLLAKRLRPAILPDRIVVVDELPRSYLAKVLRREVRHELAAASHGAGGVIR